MQIVMITGNKGKIKEVQEILKKYEIISIKDFNIEEDIEENEDTFEKNAIKKAIAYSNLLNNKLCLADDSGIEIESLNGFPGVRTKRWFDGTDRERNNAILQKMKNFTKKEQRKIKFITSIAVSDGRNIITATESISGYVSFEPKGENGFGFDEIFELEDGRTLAELSSEEKNKISARNKALKKIEKLLQKK